MKDKRYSVVLRGNVQDVGFRGRIISSARMYSIRGFPPINDVDGSVKMICEGPEELVDKFLRDIDVREELPSGIRVEVLEKKEIPIDFPIPLRPAQLEIEELSGISGKLDMGIGHLKNIEGTLGGMNQKLGTLDEVNQKLGKLDKIDETLGDMNTTLGGMNQKLGKLDKLDKIDETLGGMNQKLGTLGEINTKLDALPERIAGALKAPALGARKKPRRH